MACPRPSVRGLRLCLGWGCCLRLTVHTVQGAGLGDPTAVSSPKAAAQVDSGGGGLGLEAFALYCAIKAPCSCSCACIFANCFCKRSWGRRAFSPVQGLGLPFWAGGVTKAGFAGLATLSNLVFSIAGARLSSVTLYTCDKLMALARIVHASYRAHIHANHGTSLVM